MAKRPMLASMVIAPAMVAATELMRISRLFTCPSSCARPPSHILAVEILAKEHQQQRKPGQQERGLECISHNRIWIELFIGCYAPRSDAVRSRFRKMPMSEGIPPPPRSIGIMMLERKCNL